MTLLDNPVQDSAEAADRPVWASVGRGWRRRCPCCGQGSVFEGYVSVRHDCATCGLELHHQRANDGPAYLTIVIVGKIMTASMYAAFIAWRPEPVILASVFCLGSVAMALYLQPRIKGAMIGVQWANRMHGFGDATP